MMRAPAPYWFLASPYVEMRADIQGVLERARKLEQAPAGLDTVLDWFGHVSRQIHQAPRGGNAHFRDALNHLHQASQELNVVLAGSSGCGLLSVAALLGSAAEALRLGYELRTDSAKGGAVGSGATGWLLTALRHMPKATGAELAAMYREATGQQVSVEYVNRLRRKQKGSAGRVLIWLDEEPSP